MNPQPLQQYQFFLAQYRIFLFRNLIQLQYLCQISSSLKTVGEKLESCCRSQKGTKYNSQELDKESDLYFFNARHYDPEIARFVTADTVVDGNNAYASWNRFAYVQGNPITYKDPTGNDCVRNKTDNCDYLQIINKAAKQNNSNTKKETVQQQANRSGRPVYKPSKNGKRSGLAYPRGYRSLPKKNELDFTSVSANFTTAFGGQVSATTYTDYKGRRTTRYDASVTTGYGFGAGVTTGKLVAQDGNELTYDDLAQNGINTSAGVGPVATQIVVDNRKDKPKSKIIGVGVTAANGFIVGVITIIDKWTMSSSPQRHTDAKGSSSRSNGQSRNTKKN